MCSQKFWNDMSGAFKVLTWFFDKNYHFFISNFLHTKIPKRRRIWGMSRAVKLTKKKIIWIKQKGGVNVLWKTPRVHKRPYVVQKLVFEFRRTFFREKSFSNLGENIPVADAKLGGVISGSPKAKLVWADRKFFNFTPLIFQNVIESG